jgi:ABC-type uncharacterized transport system substrate-binding protein
MRSILPLLTVLLSCGTYFLAADAQQRPLRIAVLNPGPEVPPGFVQRLRELGHVNGKNVLIEARNGEGKAETLPKLLADWVSRKVSLIVAYGPTAIGAAARATQSIPIVMVGGGDPVLRGFVKSLSLRAAMLRACPAQQKDERQASGAAQRTVAVGETRRRAGSSQQEGCS